MIYVTVGTAAKGIDFDRLIVEMDRVAGELAAGGEEVLIQRGPSDYEPQHARHVRFVRFDEAMEFFRTARLVVGHCGAGTVINAMRFGSPLVVVPRRAASGELDTDDHQVQLARELEGKRGVRVVYEMEKLEAAVRELLASPDERPAPSEEKAKLMGAIRAELATAVASGKGSGR